MVVVMVVANGNDGELIQYRLFGVFGVPFSVVNNCDTRGDLHMA